MENTQDKESKISTNTPPKNSAPSLFSETVIKAPRKKRVLTAPLQHYFSEDEISSIILSLSTSFLLWQTGLDSSGISLWTPGNEYYDNLIYSGAISQAMSLMNNQSFDFHSENACTSPIDLCIEY